MRTDDASGAKAQTPTPYWLLVICGLTIVFDGYDMIMYGTVVPDLLKYGDWSMTVDDVGHIGSLTLVGMLIGALVIGTVTDVLGRRRVMIICLVWFSSMMPLTAIAPNPEVFAALRFVTGIGLGGVVPTAIALTVEYSPVSRRSLNNSLMFSGFSIGGVMASLLALLLLPIGGFRLMFVVGALPLVTTVPLAWKFLPESVSYLEARGRIAEAREYAVRYGLPTPGSTEGELDGSPRPTTVLALFMELFRGRRAVVTALVWAISVIGLLLVYGLNTWLPQIMRKSGYSMGSTLTFFLVFNLGAVAGVIIAGALADRLGERRVIAASFLTAALAVVLFATQPMMALLLLLGAVAGFGSNTQTLVNAFIGGLYPAATRATALGWALAVGRVGAIIGPSYGAWILTRIQDGTLSSNWSFYAFAIPAVVAAVLTVSVPRRGRDVARTRHVHSDGAVSGQGGPSHAGVEPIA